MKMSVLKLLIITLVIMNRTLRVLDPLIHGFWCVDYVLWGNNRVATYFDMISAQESMMSMINRGVEVKGMREWKNKSS